MAFTVEQIVKAAEVVMNGNMAAVARGDVSPEAGAGARAGVMALLLFLGLEISFQDGTVWRYTEGKPVEESKGDGIARPFDARKPPKDGREKLN